MRIFTSLGETPVLAKSSSSEVKMVMAASSRAHLMERSAGSTHMAFFHTYAVSPMPDRSKILRWKSRDSCEYWPVEAANESSS